MSKRKSPTKPKAPIEAKTLDQVMSLPRDGYETKDYLLVVSDSTVCLAEQHSDEQMNIPRKDFDRLVRWYMTGKVR